MNVPRIEVNIKRISVHLLEQVGNACGAMLRV